MTLSVEAAGRAADLGLVILCPDQVAERFEGIGDKCDFGLAQSFCGAEPLGLLRFSSIPHKPLMELLGSRFEALDDPRQVDVFVKPNEHEWFGRIAAFGMEYHSGATLETMNERDVLARERRRVPFLKRKLLEQLADPQKIFVRNDSRCQRWEVDELHAALRRYGENDLLWLALAEQPDQIGISQLVAPRLVEGRYGRAWRGGVLSPEGLGIWLILMNQALFVLRPQDWIGLHGSVAEELDDLKSLEVRWDCLSGGPPTRHVHLPIPEARGFVIEHRLDGDGSNSFDALVISDKLKLRADRMYVASAWVWLPEDFEGWVAIAFLDMPVVRTWPADLALRCKWQRIATSVRGPGDGALCSAALFTTGASHGLVLSVGWRIERGVVPADLLNLATNPFAKQL